MIKHRILLIVMSKIQQHKKTRSHVYVKTQKKKNTDNFTHTHIKIKKIDSILKKCKKKSPGFFLRKNKSRRKYFWILFFCFFKEIFNGKKLFKQRRLDNLMASFNLISNRDNLLHDLLKIITKFIDLFEDLVLKHRKRFDRLV